MHYAWHNYQFKAKGRGKESDATKKKVLLKAAKVW